MADTKRGGSSCLSYDEDGEGESMRIHLASVFVFGNDTYMMHLSNKINYNNHHIATTATTICALAIVIILISTSVVTPAAASTTMTTTTAAGNTTTTTTSSSEPPSLSGIKLSSQPIYEESTPPGSVTPINQTHISATHTGNGTLTLPNSNQTISTISNGTAIASLATPSAIAKTTIRAANGETATITIYEIIQFNNPVEAPLGGGKGIKIIIFHTNSTGMLAPLNGVIAAGIDIIQPNGESELTAWRWESGIPLLTGNNNTTATEQSPSSSSLMNTTTTNATTATSGTNATTGEESVEEESVGGAEVAE